MKRSIVTLAFVFGAVALTFGFQKRLDPFEGLLPKGHVIVDSPEKIDPAVMKEEALVVVTSANFDTYTKAWVNEYENGGGEKRRGRLGILAGALVASGQQSATTIGTSINNGNRVGEISAPGMRQATDPRNLSDRVTEALRPHFKSIGTATDFATAIESGARYIVLIDYFVKGGGSIEASGGVYLFDHELQRMFVVLGTAKVKAEGGGLLSSPAAMIKGQQQALTDAVTKTADQIVEGIAAKLGPSTTLGAGR